MSRRETKRDSYPCERLQDDAQLVLKYLYHDNEHKVLSAFDCEDSHLCGVGQKDPYGNWTYDWSLCPLYANRKKL
jgi:hypothetical protein